MDRFLVLHVPSVLLGTLFVLVAVAASVGGLWFVRNRTEPELLKSHNDVAGFIIAVVGVLYGVLLAFVVVVVWERFDEAGAIADREADLVLALYRDAAAFQPESSDLRASIRSYARSVIEDEWPAMAMSQRDDERTDATVVALLAAYRSVGPGPPQDQVFLEGSVERIGEIAEARRARILASSSQLPGPMWVLVLVGSAIMIGFTYFFAVPSFPAHALMVAALSAMIALTIFLLVSLTFPFTGDVAVSATAMREAIEEFLHLDAAG